MDRSALRVEVGSQASVDSAFVCVEVKAVNATRTTAPLAWKDGGLVVAVFEGDGLEGDVEVIARGFDTEKCDGLPSSESTVVSAAFPDSGFEVVKVELTAFACTCADMRCEGQPCDDGDACTEGDVCGAGACTPGTPKHCADQSECHTGSCEVATGCKQTVKTDAACTAVANGICLPDGTCSDEESNCTDGIDNDNDMLTDCLDPGCDQRSCRGAADVCDAPELCAAAACPADIFAQNTVMCRGASGDCDLPESCAGTSAACPSDVRVSDGVSCRPATGVCDVGESCDGKAPDCPADLFKPAMTTCRPANGLCDVAESCSGTSPSCGEDTFAPTTTTCRPQSDVCDVAESCSGTAPNCPADLAAAPGIICRAAAGTCDKAESCDGVQTQCPADGFEGSTVSCRQAASVCDAEDFCSGTAPACGTDTFVAPGTSCPSGTCDVSGNCVGLILFPYTTTNFDSTMYSTNATTAYNINCAVTYDSTPGATSNPADWCGALAPAGFDLIQSGGPNALVIPLKSLTVDAAGSLKFIGSRPVVLAVYGNAFVAGGIFADSTRTVPGAGATATTCVNGLGRDGKDSTTIHNNGGGGGGGGGFGSNGGSGGKGSDKDPGSAGAGASSSSTEGSLSPLRGGCPGGTGGTGAISNSDNNPAAPTTGGPGGGGVQLSVAGQLTVTGALSAGGAGGLAVASKNSGGGGGGSGGSVALEANIIDLQAGASVATNGGGGAQGAYEEKPAESGGHGTAAGAGKGGDYTSLGNDKGGRGALGGAGTSAGGTGEAERSSDGNYAGGGGGGGGVGRILLRAEGPNRMCTVQGTVSGQITKANCP